MPLSSTICEILPLVCKLTAYVTKDDLEKYFCLHVAVEVVAETIIVFSFVSDVVLSGDIRPAEMSRS